MDNGSNEWKCAGRVGRARDSSRFAQRMLGVFRGQRDEKEGRASQGHDGGRGTHRAYSGWVRDQKPTHMLAGGTEGMEVDQ